MTCTFTNRNQHTGHLTLRLDAQPDDDAQFAFKVTGNTSYPGIVLQDNGNPSDGFDNFHPVEVSPTGTYAVTLFRTSGRQSGAQQSATCSDGSPINAISISPDENVTCTFTYAKAEPS